MRQIVVWIGPLICAAMGIGLVVWTWDAWPDVLIDSGREAYIPWRLSAGQVLYRDLAYFSGPLSPYFNSLAMRVMGPGLSTLFIVNGLVIVLMTTLIYAGALRVAGRLAATLAGIGFLTIFCFGQLSFQDSCSFMFPYSHEMTHGALLLFLLAGLLWLALQKFQAWIAPAMGLAFGLLFLTKPELWVGGAALLLVGVGLAWWRWRRDISTAQTLTAVGLFAASTLAPVAIAWGLLALAMSPADATRGVLGSWVYMGDPAVTHLLYFKIWMGTLDPQDSIARMAWATGFWTLALAPAAALAWWGSTKLSFTQATVLGGAYGMALLVVMTMLVRQIQWLDLARPMPLFLLFVATRWVLSYFRYTRIDPASLRASNRAIFMLAMIALALGLQLKMGIFPRLWHYGFVLGLPSFLVVTVSLIGQFPAWLEAKGRKDVLFRLPAIAAFTGFLMGHIFIMGGVLSAKQTLVTGNGNTIRTDTRGLAVIELLDDLKTHVPPEINMAVVPEGVMLNVLSGRINPTQYSFMLPSDMKMFGEDKIVESYAKHPPSLLIIAHRYTAEYGYPYFGQHYGTHMTQWILAHYDPLVTINDNPLQDSLTQRDRFGFLVLKRR